MLDSRPAKSASPRGRPPGRGAGSGNGVPPHSGGPGRRRPRVKRLRLALILAGLAVIAAVSAVFGMLTAVTSELPDLENQAQFRAARNSVLLSDGKKGRQFAKLTGSQNRILVGQGEIAANVENAVVAVEDRRFYQHEGVDYRGVVRALVQDVRRQRVVQGGSTITQQFVKNALEAQGNRSVFQKVREAALAYRLEREWSKKKVLTQYLNSVYFGNGAYGVESAMRTYFGKGADRFDPKRRAAREAEPHEAALLAAVIASPSAYDPLQNPEAARERRDLVLRRMLEERTISPRQFARAERQALPAAEDVSPPKPDTDVPYFSTWVQEQLVDRYGAERVFGGGLRVTTTLDLELQKRAQTAVDRLSGSGPSAALVAIENRTGKVKALVGGDDFGKRPFNVATNGKRQPGSALKPFTLLAALEQGVSPDRTFASQPKTLKGNFKVANYEDDYAGVTTLRDATARSDNSVFAELGVDVVGTKKIARLARRTGIETPLSTNPAMTLGGLETGVTPLEMAYAYSTIANKGRRTSGTLASSSMGPVALERVRTEDDDLEVNRRRTRRAFSQATGDQTRQILRGVVDGGTGTAARVDGFAAGKTGTTENYGDAWFVGFDDDLTVAVWVGYPEKVREMKTEFRGAPVAGGTWPAEIWRTFMLSAHELRRQRNPDEPEPKIPEAGSGGGGGGTGVPYQAPGTGQSPGYAPSTPYAPSSPGPSYSAPSPSYSPQGPSSSGPQGPSPSPRTAPSTPSTPAPSTPSPGGTGGGGGTGGSGGGGGGSGGGGTGGGGTGGGGTTVP